MTKFKTRHFTEAARPQGRVFLVALALSVAFLIAGHFLG